MAEEEKGLRIEVQKELVVHLDDATVGDIVRLKEELSKLMEQVQGVLAEGNSRVVLVPPTKKELGSRPIE